MKINFYGSAVLALAYLEHSKLSQQKHDFKGAKPALSYCLSYFRHILVLKKFFYLFLFFLAKYIVKELRQREILINKISITTSLKAVLAYLTLIRQKFIKTSILRGLVGLASFLLSKDS